MTELKIAIANTNSGINTGEVEEFFNQNLPSFAFTAQRSGPGTKAAFDVLGVLATISSIADIYSIASALRSAYDLYVAPYKQANPSAGLYVNFKDDSGAEATFMLDAPEAAEVIVKRLKVTSRGLSAEEIHIKRP